MADKFYSCEFGSTKEGVAKAGAATPAADVEVRVTYDAAGNSKLALITALDVIREKIIEDTWPPA